MSNSLKAKKLHVSRQTSRQKSSFLLDNVWMFQFPQQRDFSDRIAWHAFFAEKRKLSDFRVSKLFETAKLTRPNESSSTQRLRPFSYFWLCRLCRMFLRQVYRAFENP